MKKVLAVMAFMNLAFWANRELLKMPMIKRRRRGRKCFHPWRCNSFRDEASNDATNRPFLRRIREETNYQGSEAIDYSNYRDYEFIRHRALVSDENANASKKSFFSKSSVDDTSRMENFVSKCTTYLLSEDATSDEKISQVDSTNFLVYYSIEEGICSGNPKDECSNLTYGQLDKLLQLTFVWAICPRENLLSSYTDTRGVGGDDDDESCIENLLAQGDEFGWILTGDIQNLITVANEVQNYCSSLWDFAGELHGDGDSTGRQTMHPTSPPKLSPPVTLPTIVTSSPSSSPVPISTVRSNNTISSMEQPSHPENGSSTTRSGRKYGWNFVIALFFATLYVSGATYLFLKTQRNLEMKDDLPDHQLIDNNHVSSSRHSIHSDLLNGDDEDKEGIIAPALSRSTPLAWDQNSKQMLSPPSLLPVIVENPNNSDSSAGGDVSASMMSTEQEVREKNHCHVDEHRSSDNSANISGTESSELEGGNINGYGEDEDGDEANASSVYNFQNGKKVISPTSRLCVPIENEKDIPKEEKWRKRRGNGNIFFPSSSAPRTFLNGRPSDVNVHHPLMVEHDEEGFISNGRANFIPPSIVRNTSFHPQRKNMIQSWKPHPMRCWNGCKCQTRHSNAGG